MKVERIFQISVALLTVLGSIFLGLGKGDIVYPLAMALVAVTSLFFTDTLGFGIGRPVAGTATLLFLVYSFSNIAGREDRNRLETITNLLIFLQVMLLYLEKRHSIYWLLIVLSLLEVVVAAALNVGVEFGMLLVVFMILNFVTLTLFYVLRETAPAGTRLTANSTGSESDNSQAWIRGDALVVEPALTDGQLLCFPFMRQIGAICLISVVFAVFAFYAMRRVPNLSWQSGRGARQSTVGFSPRVSLDEMGKVLQSDEIAMRVGLEEARSGNPYILVEEPYFRGLVLTNYSQRDRSAVWQPSQQDTLVKVPAATTSNNIVLQHIYLAPTTDSTVFSVFPPRAVAGTPPELFMDNANGRIVRLSPPRDSTPSAQPFYYTLGTDGLRGGRSMQVVPISGPRPLMNDNEERQFREQFPILRRVADEVLRAEQSEGMDWYKQAKALERHFTESGRYQYTLNFNFARNEELDPIEDFVANHKQGHCEYFASALALMLRTQGIPARLVVGYHGGEYNRLGDYYLVRQSDAHAWVEVYMRPTDLLAAGIVDVSNYPSGGWLRLDPTPGSSAFLATAPEMSFLDRLGNVLDYAQFLWNDYVLGFHPQATRRGTELGPDELAEYMLASINYDVILNSLWQSWHASERSIWAQIWRVSLVAIILVLATWIVLRMRQWYGARLASWWRRMQIKLRLSRETVPDRHRRMTEFYLQFERVMARHGWRRAASQTPEEFGRQLVNLLAERAPELIDPCRRIIRAFYQVRFGGSTLDKTQTQAIEHHLLEIRSGLEQRASARELG
ncbi:MAG: DUF3488 domain-containing protein [Planctomycetes bacterium]|nr:DUF3488 domain-containing protein [Planctomycetota bacterium]